MKAELLESFLELYHEEMEGVFRFHSVRCADWITAQAYTVETFITALQFYDPLKIGPGRKRVWLWRIAFLAKERQLKGVDGLAYSGDLLPTQEQLASYVHTAQLNAQMASASQGEQDVLFLYYASDLVPEEIQEIIGEDLARVQDWLSRQAGEETLRLIRSLRPVGYFFNRLESELRKRAERSPRRGMSLDGPMVWLARYRLRSVLMWIFRFALLLALTYLLLRAWNAYIVGYVP